MASRQGIKRLFVANRGEIAIRILRTAAEMGMPAVAVYSEDDAASLHVSLAGEAVALAGKGAAPYLDIDGMVEAMKSAGCDAVHPGYGFLSENARFAQACARAGITFVGPAPATLEVFGDKAQALELARRCKVPVSRSTPALRSAAEAQRFLASLGEGGAMVIKAIAGGGGRGIRVVREAGDVAEAYKRCQSEAQASFGVGDVYAEEFVMQARHVEVQVIGDGTGAASHLWERECSVQRNHQKIVEFAPSAALSPSLRERLTAAAVAMAKEARYRGLGTFEFLVSEGAGGGQGFVFIEANPRLQVEHTVTEEITGLDLVKLQLQIAAGATLAGLGLEQKDVPQPRGCALQLRINMERMQPDGTVRPSGGTIAAWQPPTGPGVRVDAFGYAGYTTSANFDSLLAKLIVHAPGFEAATRRALRALGEFRLEGVATNIGFLQNLLEHPGFIANRLHTGFVGEHIQALAAARKSVGDAPAATRAGFAGAKVDRSDPLAVFGVGKSGGARPSTAPAAAPARASTVAGPDGASAVAAPVQGTVIAIEVAEGEAVAAGRQVMVMEAMKMEYSIPATVSGTVRLVNVALTDTVLEGYPLLFIEEGDVSVDAASAGRDQDPTRVRPDLAELLERRKLLQDEARPEAVARRRKTRQRTVRENVADLFDPGSFVEYFGLGIAAQRYRHTDEELMRISPADGCVTGIGRVNGALFGEESAKCAVMAYDYTVFAGTQGDVNHRKMDRLLALTRKSRVPVVLFAEGGGGRPGDIKTTGGTHTFTAFPQMSGQAPLVGITTGFCFAGNAALLGCCDVVIATKGSNIGMGGPAMIEGGGLGVFRPEDIGPVNVQVKNGVVDVLVEDEAEGVRVAKQYLGYFQGSLREWQCADQRLLRGLVPEDRRRVYDIRAVAATIADDGSMLELRREFGIGILTALIRVEGKPFGLIANNPRHLGGAIDSDAADKGARFLQLCDNFGIPIVSLCDTPGIMVGPEAEKTALVRHASRLLVTGANLKVPMFAVVLRKGYGIGRIAMLGGNNRLPFFCVSWPTGEFGGMNLEGAVKLGFRKELAAITDPAERLKKYQDMVAEQYRKGRALTAATDLAVDDVIDPAETRQWIMMGWMATRGEYGRSGRSYIDAW